MEALLPDTLVSGQLACVASKAFPFGFGAKKDRGTGFSVLAAREMKQEPKNESGGRGRGTEGNARRQTPQF